MGGYFRQLAEQALGVSPRLRPVIAPRGMDGDAGEPDEALHPEHRPTHAATIPSAIGRRDVQHPAQRVPRAPLQVDAEAAPSPSPVAGSSEDASEPRTPASPGEGTVSDRGAQPAMHERHSSQSHAASPKPTPTAGHTEALQYRAAPAAGRTAPSPRLAGAATLRTPPSQPRRDGPARRATTVPAPAPEVHIHIGRIELTAVNPAPAPKRDTGHRKPMTLDEYLGGRGGSGR